MDLSDTQTLLKRALRILGNTTLPEDHWALGGGTVLAHYYQHRRSKDIDIFIDDAQCLARLSPRLNDLSEDALDYAEMGHYISLTFPEGKIDFITSTQISNHKPTRKNFLGREIPLEDAVEIIAKKVFYRGNAIVPRDLFDLAVVYDSARKEDVLATLLSIAENTDRFMEALVENDRLHTPLYSIENAEMLLPKGTPYRGQERQICLRLREQYIKMRRC